MHRVRDSTASACSRANRILVAYFYLCSKLISLNRINSLSLHFAPRIPKVRRARICISDRASLPGIFRPPSFRHVMENAARVPLTMTASVFVRFFRERAATADARGRTSFYIPLATWKRTCTVAVPPECLLSVSLALATPLGLRRSLRHFCSPRPSRSRSRTEQWRIHTSNCSRHINPRPPLVDPTRLS